MPGINFDPASAYYDKTRGYPPGVAEAIRDAILNKLQPGSNSSTRFLELGVGTGRIAQPFIQAGYDYVGVDLSLAMMGQLRQKFAGKSVTHNNHCQLLQADITCLPFKEASFDVAITVHVLHLVANWQKALREAHRVLRKPGGYLFIGKDSPASDISQMATTLTVKKWDAILEDLGVNLDSRLPGLKDSAPNWDETVEVFLQQLGAKTERVNLVEYTTASLSPRMLAQGHIERIYSSDWRIPADIHAAASKRLQAWLDTECPEPDRAFSISNTFRTIVAKWKLLLIGL